MGTESNVSAATLIFPHQLFKDHPALDKNWPVYLVEEFLFFRQYNFHKQKLIFHRACMKAFQHFLEAKGYQVRYVESTEKISDVRQLLPALKKSGISKIHYSDVLDNFLQRRIERGSAQSEIEITVYNAQLFLLTSTQIDEYFANRTSFLQADFYTRQRKDFNILVNEKSEPTGGKWSFDAENRLRYPKGKRPPKVEFPVPNQHWIEATQYIKTHFPSNYGEISNSFIYPTTYQEAQQWLQQFFRYRFSAFGTYEDAVVKNEHILHHSVLTPMLNVGLLTPDDVLDQCISYAKRHNIPLNSCEGFVRQVLGWREFVRGVYQTKGTQQRTTNFWKFKRKIPKSFWNGTTGIDPVDNTIRKVLMSGYCHHIERLMVMGNFMLLCEFDPDEVYRWFMELFIDAYDWVMVPNVYGMSQFADGGLMATKPYISGSNYLMKMSDFEKGEWQSTWDGLFWRFMHTHRGFFSKNPRLGMLVKTFDKMSEEKRNDHIRIANEYLENLDKT